MATPLQLRNRRREAQRAVRLAFNAVNAALDDWKGAVSEGRRHATALTNAALTRAHLPALPLGLLAGVPNLKEAATAKLLQQQAAALDGLAACLEQLQAAVAALEQASASLRQLLDAEAGQPVLAEGAVFATLSLQLLSGMVGDVLGMHRDELAVKAAVCQGFETILGEQRAAEKQAGEEGDARAGTGAAAAQREQRLRSTMQVYLTAWVLSPRVDERLEEAHLARLREEMRGF